MVVEKQSDGSIQRQGSIIADDEAKFIAKSGQRPIFVEGMLSRVRRTGQTLEQIYQHAISEPGNEEHILAVTQARDFLRENSERFNLEIAPDEPI